MRVVVIGAGIIGVTSAYYLRQAGFDVTVFERNSGVAQETSYGNAGVIAPAYIGPWAQPGMPGKILAYLFKPHAPVLFRPTLDRSLWRWLRRWYDECALERFVRNKARMQRIAYYSRDQLRALRARLDLEYEQTAGYLQLFRTQRELDRCAPARKLLADAGVPHRMLAAEECRALEPALAPSAQLAGGLHLPDDETGNCAFFARQLKDIAESDGVAFRFGAAVTGFDVQNGSLRGVLVDGSPVSADLCVLAAGIDSAGYLAQLGIDLAIYPVKGYAATVPVTNHEHAPHLAVMDEDYKVAVTRMGQRLRIAGTAEIGSRRLKLRASALRTLIRVAIDWFPSAAAYAQAQYWVGARPMLPDGPPLLGSTPIRGLILNVGHGSSGWAMACGCARVVADLAAGRTPEIDLDGLTLARYAGTATA
ncbi:MAG TPA: D-amino acid dehydrogenase [Burkholderiaceae bacterium]|nr:D-amino acid dehydrogenase [Burkholderiaceae bacterium]